MKRLKRKDLKPGSYVANKMTKSVGLVRHDTRDPKKLRRAHNDYVAVRVRNQTRPGRWCYPYWSLVNVEVCDS